MTAAGSIKAAYDAICAANPRPRRGRPPIPGSERARQPWVEAGVSPRTHYRRKARARASAAAAAPLAPQRHAEQNAAHVAAWFATLGAIARLEHRAFVRRCLLATRRGR